MDSGSQWITKRQPEKGTRAMVPGWNKWRALSAQLPLSTASSFSVTAIFTQDDTDGRTQRAFPVQCCCVFIVWIIFWPVHLTSVRSDLCWLWQQISIKPSPWGENNNLTATVAAIVCSSVCVCVLCGRKTLTSDSAVCCFLYVYNNDHGWVILWNVSSLSPRDKEIHRYNLEKETTTKLETHTWRWWKKLALQNRKKHASKLSICQLGKTIIVSVV